MKIERFRGLDNVHTGDEEHKLKPGDLVEATNCDITDQGGIERRSGFSLDTAGSWASAWKGAAFQLAVKGSDLVNADDGTVLHAGLTAAAARMHFVQLPDGRVAYSNGTDTGMVSASGASRTAWGVPIPSSVGVGANAGGGSLPSGEYRYCLTHRRTADGLQGGAIDSGRITVTTGALAITGIPTLAGHTTEVWITPKDGSEFYYAGSTSGTTYTQTSSASRDLVCPTRFCKGPDDLDGILVAFWRGRVLLASGEVLYASRARTLHLFNIREDFRRMAGTITMVAPVESGIWIGTSKGLFFLGTGGRFDQLAMNRRIEGAVLPGSAVKVAGRALMRGDSLAGDGNDGFLCIANRRITACYADGSCAALTDNRYHVADDVTEVAATWREADGVSQYIAIPQ